MGAVIETSQNQNVQYYANNTFSISITANGYQRLTVFLPASGGKMNVTITSSSMNYTCNNTCINGFQTSICGCECNPGYAGISCERPANCLGSCSNQGYCVSDNTCICDSRHSVS